MRHPLLTACASGAAALIATALLGTPANAAEPESLTAVVYGGVMMIHGTEGPDNMVLQRGEDYGAEFPPGEVVIYSERDVTAGPGCTTVNHSAYYVACAGATRMIVDLGGGDDGFTDQDYAVPILVNAGAGNDKVNTAGGDDIINGGDGNDELAGFGGHDVVNGGGGDDSCSGEVVNLCEHDLP